ncbi:MAG: ABC transporter permease [Candidatus Aminicenantes bacterium]|nr:ABC transporter permease [Candidatus Aminicenantes bacterium]
MIKNYIKSALRNISRSKGYSFINIFGLAIGMSVCILILLYVRDEMSFDDFHQHADRIYRVERAYRMADGSVQPYFCTLAPSFVPLLEGEFAEIEHAARLFGPPNVLVKIGETGFSEEKLYFAEDDIFEIFTIPLLKGDTKTALKEPYSIVLSRTMADKYFKDKDPMGKEMLLDNRFLVKVTGVMEDTPANSHIHMNFLVSYISLKGLQGQGDGDYFLGTRNFTDNVTLVYVRLAENTTPESIQPRVPEFLDKHIPARENREGELVKTSEQVFFHFRKVPGIHLLSHLTKEVEPNSDIRYVLIFSAIAAFILIIACINFMNLSTARASKRAKEVGLRKVVGADRKILSLQFLGESFLVCFFAVIAALGLVLLVLPAFRSFSGHAIFLHDVFSPAGLLILGGVLFVSGIAAGLYPAFYLSSFRPVTILKGEMTGGKKGRLTRKFLVVFQFSITIALIFSVFVVNKQMSYLQNTDVGYDRENIVLIPADNEVITRWETLKQELLKNPKILSACLSKRAPTGRLLDAPGFGIEINGERIVSPFDMPHNRVSHDFFKTYGMKIIAGRDFSVEHADDTMKAYILNETAVRRLGIKDPKDVIGAPFRALGGGQGYVVGVAKDFNYESMRDQIKPIVTYVLPQQANTLSLRLVKGNIRQTLNEVKDIWSRFRSGYPLQFTFLNERLNQLYRNEERMLAMFGYFSLLAIIIGCLGLFGLASFTAEQRTKEIGVRKTLGASASNIVRLLSMEFAKWVVLANIIAWPLAYWAMTSWLGNFAYKTEIGVMPFVISAGLALAVAVFTVIYQSIKAASTDPVTALRYE